MVSLGSSRTRGGPGSTESTQGVNSAIRVKAFTVCSTGVPAAHTTSSFGPWACNFGSTSILLTWPTPVDTWGLITTTTTGWRTDRLPFPCTPCLRLLTIDGVGISNQRVRFRVTGVGQFGEPVQETLPWVRLIQDVAGTSMFSHIWCSRVFATVTAVEYQTAGAAPSVGAQLACGMYFNWDPDLKSSVASAAIGSTYFFPFNQGIGTQIRLAGERAPRLGAYPGVVAGLPPLQRFTYPEVLSVTIRTPTGGPAGTAQIMPVGINDNRADDPLTGDNPPGGFLMGYSLAAERVNGGVDLLNTETSVGSFEGDANKIGFESRTKRADGQGSEIFLAWDGTTRIPAYTPSAGGAADDMDNAATLIYDFTFRSLLGARNAAQVRSYNGVS